MGGGCGGGVVGALNRKEVVCWQKTEGSPEDLATFCHYFSILWLPVKTPGHQNLLAGVMPWPDPPACPLSAHTFPTLQLSDDSKI